MSRESFSSEPAHTVEQREQSVAEESLILGHFLLRDQLPTREGESQESWEQYVDMVERCAQEARLYIDKGGAGTVFAIHGTGFCVKFVKNRHDETIDGIRYDKGNDISLEANIQQTLQRVSVKGARVPKCLRVLHGTTHSAFLMEQLNAVNLAKVLAGEEEMPAAFDHDKCFDAVEQFLEEMHAQHHIQHGDLKARNIMIDRETGMPYIIDFGRSKRLHEEDSQFESQIGVDWDDYQEVEQSVRRHMDTLQNK